MTAEEPRPGADGLIGCERGAMYVEALVMIPIFVVLWIILIFIEHGNTVDNDVVERSRYCAWRHAVDQCKGTPMDGCELSEREEVSLAMLDGASGSALTTLIRRTPYLGRNSDPAGVEWQYPHGGYFRAETEADLERPLGWSSIHVTSDQTWMCQVPDSYWTYPLVYYATCSYYGLAYCPGGGGLGGLGGGSGGGGGGGFSGGGGGFGGGGANGGWKP
jgi:uncharacterized membrane protein YgcG